MYCGPPLKITTESDYNHGIACTPHFLCRKTRSLSQNNHQLYSGLKKRVVSQILLAGSGSQYLLPTIDPIFAKFFEWPFTKTRS
jgi:hypothetical protein